MAGQHFATGFVKVGNRSDQDITVTYDGRSCVIPAGAFVFMSEAAAQRAVYQARIWGTEDPYQPDQFESYLFVDGWDLPTTKVKYDQSKLEAMDRSKLPATLQHVEKMESGRVRPEIGGEPMSEARQVAFAGEPK